ncbi:hypothetical protein CONPUDRAFT_31201, partial [Coniophora puteana RWD-64-598 SS2]
RIQCWAHLQLPNWQVAHSTWQEDMMTKGVCQSQNVLMTHLQIKVFAMVSVYGPPDTDLQQRSFDTLHACEHQGDADLCIVDVKAIHSVVAMVP